MDKAQILATIKSNIGTTDTRFDLTISKFIDRHKLTEVADAELNLDQYTEDLKWTYEQAIGLANHELAEAKKAWEKQKPTDPPTPPTPPTPPAPDPAMQDMQKAIDELKNQMKAAQSQQIIEAIRSQVLGRGKELKANEKLWELAVAQTAIAEGATLESVEAAVKPAYEALQKSVFGNSSAPYGKADNNPESELKSSMDAFFASKGFGKSK